MLKITACCSMNARLLWEICKRLSTRSWRETLPYLSPSFLQARMLLRSLIAAEVKKDVKNTNQSVGTRKSVCAVMCGIHGHMHYSSRTLCSDLKPRPPDKLDSTRDEKKCPIER